MKISRDPSLTMVDNKYTHTHTHTHAHTNNKGVGFLPPPPFSSSPYLVVLLRLELPPTHVLPYLPQLCESLIIRVVLHLAKRVVLVELIQ